MKAPSLSFDIQPFEAEIISIAKRGSETIAVMSRGGASPERLEKERQELRRDVLNCRLRISSQFQDVLTGIIRQNELQ